MGYPSQYWEGHECSVWGVILITGRTFHLICGAGLLSVGIVILGAGDF